MLDSTDLQKKPLQLTGWFIIPPGEFMILTLLDVSEAGIAHTQTVFSTRATRCADNLSKVLVLRAWRAKDRFESMLVSENAGLRTRRSTPPTLKSVGEDVSVSSLTDAIGGVPTEAFWME